SSPPPPSGAPVDFLHLNHSFQPTGRFWNLKQGVFPSFRAKQAFCAPNFRQMPDGNGKYYLIMPKIGVRRVFTKSSFFFQIFFGLPCYGIRTDGS
ncbi:hypothetical protein, partial [Flavonifractor sp. An92]|uniref:hypothetical protein n=1 Tax=Flavonifractor sp. An92 TaxID=1965666 RepID=UPI0019D1872B